LGDTPEREIRSVPMESVGGVKKKSKSKESRYGKRYGFEFKLRCVKWRLEEGLPVCLLSKEVGASRDVPSFYRAFRRLKKSLLSKPRVLKKDKMSVESHLTEV